MTRTATILSTLFLLTLTQLSAQPQLQATQAQHLSQAKHAQPQPQKQTQPQPQTAAQHLPQATQAQRLRVNKVLDSCIARGFNGALLIADHGTITYLKYTGIANRHHDIPFSRDTRFQIFSVTKTFTAALILDRKSVV